jgi:hypothetical protein
LIIETSSKSKNSAARWTVPHVTRDAATRRLDEHVPVPIPAGRRPHRRPLVLQVLEQQNAGLELTQVVLVDVPPDVRRWQYDRGRVIAAREVAVRVHHLLGRHGHPAERRLTLGVRLELAHELGAREIREDQRLLEDHRRRCKDRHRSLHLADHLTEAIPATRHRGDRVVGTDHRPELLERGLPLHHGLASRQAVIVVASLGQRVEVEMLILSA